MGLLEKQVGRVEISEAQVVTKATVAAAECPATALTGLADLATGRIR